MITVMIITDSIKNNEFSLQVSYEYCLKHEKEIRAHIDEAESGA